MKEATLAQGNQVLNLILQKKASSEKIQKLIASGLLSDLLDADLDRVERLGFRKILGLLSFQHDKAKDGWELADNALFGGAFTPDIKELLKPGEYSVDGEVMKRRARELNANLGQHHAEYLLEHQELIPKELRGRVCLVFPGTVWLDGGGLRCVPCLDWDSGRWCLFFRMFGDGWRHYDRLVKPRE